MGFGCENLQEAFETLQSFWRRQEFDISIYRLPFLLGNFIGYIKHQLLACLYLPLRT